MLTKKNKQIVSLSTVTMLVMLLGVWLFAQDTSSTILGLSSKSTGLVMFLSTPALLIALAYLSHKNPLPKEKSRSEQSIQLPLLKIHAAFIALLPLSSWLGNHKDMESIFFGISNNTLWILAILGQVALLIAMMVKAASTNNEHISFVSK